MITPRDKARVRLDAHAALIGNQLACDAMMKLSEEERALITDEVTAALIEYGQACREMERQRCAEIVDMYQKDAESLVGQTNVPSQWTDAVETAHDIAAAIRSGK